MSEEMKVRCAHDRLVEIEALRPHPKNRNKHPNAQIERLAQILRYQGFRYPVKVSNLSGFVTSGHGRIEAARLNGWTHVPVNYQDYADEAQEYADLQADNAIASWAELDLSGINADIGDLGPDFDIDLLGIKNFKIDVAEKDPEDDDKAPGMPVQAITKRGDIWQLGRHRLMCGDSTGIDDVEKLMAGEKAALWVTDPPYGVSYADKNEFLNSLGKPNSVTKRIENDHRPIEEMKEFWQLAASNALMACSDAAPYYWFACQGGDQMMMMMSISDAGWKVRHELIWVKNNHVMGRCDYQYKHEPILYGWKKDGTHKFYGGFQTSVMEFPKPQSSKLHPTMKPVELIERLIENSSQNGETIFDSFGGSGTTIIACEKTRRRCFMMELDPVYCDVIVKRWENYTGQKAELIDAEQESNRNGEQ